jgi:hypothetical protein
MRSGYSRSRTSKNKKFLLGGAMSLKFKPSLIMHTTSTQIILAYSLISWGHDHTLNSFMLALHIITRYRYQFETNIPINTNSNKVSTDSEYKARMNTHCFNFVSKGVGEANNWILQS